MSNELSNRELIWLSENNLKETGDGTQIVDTPRGRFSLRSPDPIPKKPKKEKPTKNANRKGKKGTSR